MLALTLGPYLLGAFAAPLAGIGLNGVANFIFGIALVWAALFLPYFGVYQAPSFFVLLSIAVIQSLIAGAFVGRLTARQPMIRTVLATVAALIVLGLFAHGVLRGLNLGYGFEGP